MTKWHLRLCQDAATALRLSHELTCCGVRPPLYHQHAERLGQLILFRLDDFCKPCLKAYSNYPEPQETA